MVFVGFGTRKELTTRIEKKSGTKFSCLERGPERKLDFWELSGSVRIWDGGVEPSLGFKTCQLSSQVLGNLLPFDFRHPQKALNRHKVRVCCSRGK